MAKPPRKDDLPNIEVITLDKFPSRSVFGGDVKPNLNLKSVAKSKNKIRKHATKKLSKKTEQNKRPKAETKPVKADSSASRSDIGRRRNTEIFNKSNVENHLNNLQQCALEARRIFSKPITTTPSLDRGNEYRPTIWCSNSFGTGHTRLKMHDYVEKKENSAAIRERYRSEIEILRARLIEMRNQKKALGRKTPLSAKLLDLDTAPPTLKTKSYFDYNAYKKLSDSIAKKSVLQEDVTKKVMEIENKFSKYQPSVSNLKTNASTYRRELNVTTSLKLNEPDTSNVQRRYSLITDNAKILFGQKSNTSIQMRLPSSRDKPKLKTDLHQGDNESKYFKLKKTWTTLPSAPSERSYSSNLDDEIMKNDEKEKVLESENIAAPEQGTKSISPSISSYKDDPLPNKLERIPKFADDMSLQSNSLLRKAGIIYGKPRCLESGDSLTPKWSIRKSLFPFVPPYWKFVDHDIPEKVTVPYTARRLFKWKMTNITPNIVRDVIIKSGFQLSRTTSEWLGTWGKHMKSPMYKDMKELQKLNHFPGTFHLGRKDRLWKNLEALLNKFGEEEFGIMPFTYLIPDEIMILKDDWTHKNESGGEGKWILKPPASARGIGIKVISKFSDIPRKMCRIVQLYISRPYLINGNKFDLRLYVLVTSFCPLKIYLWPEGLVRFASAKYNDDVEHLDNKYIHLTNYSINKNSSEYTNNDDANSCQGHKWTLTKLWEFLENQGKDTRTLWNQLKDICIKAIISSELYITPLCEENMNDRYNCYELFGVDILLDYNLKPWLIEFNISPSLHSATPLDVHVKGPLVKTVFDLAQYHIPILPFCCKSDPAQYDSRMYTMSLMKNELHKHYFYEHVRSRKEYIDDILTNLTGDDVRQLLLAEDEYEVKGQFERIFPTAHSYSYLKFMEPRYYNRLLDAWEEKYSQSRVVGISHLQRYCGEKLHLKVTESSMSVRNSTTIAVPADSTVELRWKDTHRSMVSESILGKSMFEYKKKL